jgi:hypothetical protein
MIPDSRLRLVLRGDWRGRRAAQAEGHMISSTVFGFDGEMSASVRCVLRLPPRSPQLVRLGVRFNIAIWIADSADGGNGLGNLLICGGTPAVFFRWRHLRQESVAEFVIDEDWGEDAAVLG